MQGLGLFTLEELKFSPSGVLYTRGPSQYKIPAVCDVPLRFNVYLLPDSPNPHAIYSSKVRPDSSKQMEISVKRPSWFCSSSGHWRTHRLPGQLRLLRHQGCGGGGPFRVWIGWPVFPGRAGDSRAGLPGLCLTLHSDGKKKSELFLIF